jgi:hypothetical protein
MLEILEEQKLETQLTLNTPIGAPYIRKKSVMASRKSAGNIEDAAMEETRKLDANELK